MATEHWEAVGQPSMNLSTVYMTAVNGPYGQITLVGGEYIATTQRWSVKVAAQSGVGGGWAGVNWVEIMSDMDGPPAAALGSSGLVEYAASRGRSILLRKDGPAGGHTTPIEISGPGSKVELPALGRQNDDRLILLAGLAAGPGYYLLCAEQLGNGAWPAGFGASGLGGFLAAGQAAFGRNEDGRLELFVADTNGVLHHAWQQAPNTGCVGWSSFVSMGGPPIGGRIVVVNNADGRLEVIVEARDKTLWHHWQAWPNGAWAPEWASFGAWRFPSATLGHDGRLNVVAGRDDGTVVRITQLAPSSTWREPSVLGTDLYYPVIARDITQRLNVFATRWIGGQAQVMHRRQVALGRWISPSDVPVPPPP